MQQLYDLTDTLIFELERLKDIFYKPNDSMENKQAYFQHVKKETIPIFDMLSKWEEKTLAFIKEGNGYVHPKQIIATKENMELIILHSFYKDIRKRRYMEYYSSCLYVFNQLKEEIHR